MENQLNMTTAEKELMQDIARKATEIMTEETKTTRLKKKQEALDL